ncbi:hypothetical protein KSP40_PGU009951 [Platanthera guangdongensis]|uniref:Pentatricopeptide repeat-containing protein n=1 Tax=Platanthera guangdongensis TaxID=2320717 RepID=A0ABR2MV21_9ASPA
MTQKLPPLFLSNRFTFFISRAHLFHSTPSPDPARIPTKSALIDPKQDDIESASIFLKKKLHPDVLASVLDSVTDASSASAIFRWSSGQNNFCHTPKTYARLISRLGLARNGGEMELFLKEMVRLQSSELNAALEFLVDYFCSSQSTREALKVFEIARSSNLRFSLSTCNILLRSLVSERGKFDLVIFVYKEMVKAEILPDTDTLNHVIKGLCDLGQLDSALIQFDRMKRKSCSPNSLTFELIISALCHGGRTGEAVDFWKQMFRLKCRPDSEFYVKIIPLFCAANKMDESVHLFKMMKKDGNSPGIYLYSDLIHCLSENLQLNVAVEMLGEMSESGITPKASSYIHIVNGYCKLGNLHEAKKFLNGIIDCPVEPYHVLLNSLCNFDRFSEAVDLLEEMLERSYSGHLLWNIIVNGFCKKGNVKRAFEVICRMVVFSCLPNDSTHSSLITGFCMHAEFDKAFRIFKQASVQGMCLDSGPCSELIEGLCSSKKIQEASEIFYHLSYKGCSPNISSLEVLINEICGAGKVVEAMKVRSLASCNGARLSSSTCSPIFAGLFELNKEKHILPLLSQMFVEGYSLDQEAYFILIHGFYVRGRSGIASNLFDRMVDDGIIPGSEELEKIIEIFAECSLVRSVANSLEKLVESGAVLGPFVCNAAISSLVKEGHNTVACKFLDWMIESGWVPDPYTHGLLVGNKSVLEAKDGLNNACDDDYTDNVGNILAEGLRSSA